MEKQDERKYYSVYFFNEEDYYAGYYGKTNERKLTIVDGQYKNIFGKTKYTYRSYNCYFYAIKDKNDFFDPITCEKITDYVGGGPYYYARLDEIEDQDKLKSMAEQIKEINGNEKLKNEYIEWLERYSSLTRRVLKRKYEIEQKKLQLANQREEEKQKALDYLNSYNIHNK